MEQAITWVTENRELLILIGFTAALCFVCVYPVIFFRPKAKASIVSGEKEIMIATRAKYERQEHERRLKERQLVVDGFEDMLLGLYSQGKISESCYKYWHGKLATAVTISDYMSGQRALSPDEAKKILKSRRNGGTYHHLYEPVDIPGPKPGEKEAPKPRNELEALIFTLSHVNHR